MNSTMVTSEQYDFDLPSELQPIFALPWTDGKMALPCVECGSDRSDCWFLYTICPEALFPFSKTTAVSHVAYSIPWKQGFKELSTYVCVCDDCYNKVLPKYVVLGTVGNYLPLAKHYIFLVLQLKPKVNSKSARNIQ